VARIDGDHFVVLCPAMSPDAAQALAQEVLERIALPITVAEREVVVGATVGVASTDQTEPSQLLGAAQAAMYRGKATGRARVGLFDPREHGDRGVDLELVADLRAALEDDALVLHYQPVIDLTTETCRGAEALLRWNHPRLGPMAPADVVGLAERGGLGDDLNRWVLRRACSDAASWRAGDDDLTVAVNTSPLQLASEDLDDALRDALVRSGLPPRRLALEIPEAAIIEPSIGERLERVRGLGLRITLDDFGMGYASLAHVKALPLDQLKIDATFVRDLTSEPAATAIVTSLAALAAGIGMDLVAEGVESRNQAERLRRLGCRQAQGFLWSAAVPGERLLDVIDRLRPRSLRQRRARSESVVEPGAASRMRAMARRGASPHTIAAALNAEGLLTPRGTKWHRSSVRAHLDRLAAETDGP
jgi:predicted signal transduction protein with EAL and GGDEF domain